MVATKKTLGPTFTITLVTAKTSLPSFRLRMASLRPVLEERGWVVQTCALPRRPEWWRVWVRRELWRRSNVLIFSKQKLLPLERALVHRWCRAWVVDLDDAVMFAKPRRAGEAPSQAWWRQRRLQRMVELAALTVVASSVLADWVRPYAQRLQVLPTPVDLSRYPVAAHAPSDKLRLAWIGLPGNFRYLVELGPVLRQLVADGLNIELHVISAGIPHLEGVPMREVAWSEDSEGASLAACDVGLAPLTDDVWTRGKGAYRSIQYAAAGLPTVASPVGANRDVVLQEETGLWASTHEEWLGALRRLAADRTLRRQMGAAARAHAARFDLPLYTNRYLHLLEEILFPFFPPAEAGRQGWTLEQRQEDSHDATVGHFCGSVGSSQDMGGRAAHRT